MSFDNQEPLEGLREAGHERGLASLREHLDKLPDAIASGRDALVDWVLVAAFYSVADWQGIKGLEVIRDTLSTAGYEPFVGKIEDPSPELMENADAFARFIVSHYLAVVGYSDSERPSRAHSYRLTIQEWAYLYWQRHVPEADETE
jgi:hypothetical protein